MWAVVYIAQNKTKAEKIRDMLTAEGLLVNLRGIDVADPDNISRSVEILVPQSEAEEAHEIINDILSV